MISCQIRKRSYHPFLLVLFHLNILDKEVIRQIPYSTISHWNNRDHTDYFGYEFAQEYMNNHKDIRAVFTSKQLYRFVRFACRLHDAYTRLLEMKTKAELKLHEIHRSIVEATDQLSRTVPRKVAARLMNISYQSYYRFRNNLKCSKSKINRCFRSLPQQLSLREIQVIDKAMSLPENFGKTKTTIYHALRNAGKLLCSLSTFYCYTHDYVLPSAKRKTVREKLRAERLFQYLHVDITELICADGRKYVAFVKDNFSKAILGHRILEKRSSSNIRSLFEEIFEKYNLSVHPERISIVSDGGSENKGELLRWMAEFVPEVKKLTSGIDVRSNAMSESVHHILKNEFLRGKIPEDPVTTLIRFVNYHNNERYPVEHFGYTCNEVLQGAKPDPKRFAKQQAEARQIRKIENQTFSCLKGIGCNTTIG